MTKPQVTRERKCPKCGSANVKYQQLSHAEGVGQRISKVKKYQYKCSDCETIFSFRGEHP